MRHCTQLLKDQVAEAASYEVRELTAFLNFFKKEISERLIRGNFLGYRRVIGSVQEKVGSSYHQEGNLPAQHVLN
jgi:hypothetical protein